MIRVAFSFAVFCLALLLSGCDSAMNIQFPSDALDLVVYDYASSAALASNKTYAVREGTQTFQLLKTALTSGDEEWQKSYQTYAPKYEIRSDAFVLNITQDLLVLNYKTGKKKWRQVVRPQPPEFLSKFVGVVKQEVLEGSDGGQASERKPVVDD